ncbi:forkhead box protein N4 isoform X2 [Boleophthalmus pectinirostris]|uniref:forkhead box protein N4 isoform X2 n=1 Tax=Boleophthalmus pectinirostris TaxID=150288 RepID=UPI00242DFE7D|nr:forkhead box protein N4 isoform X2 [Boleophthalmus pectinirostris]
MVLGLTESVGSSSKPKSQINSIPMTGQSSMLHLQSNMQHSPLGISIINSHSGSMSPFSMSGVPSPGYQCPTSVYQPTQQVYSLAQNGQQCSAGGLYNNVSFPNQSIYTQPRLAPQEQELQPKTFPKPIYSYSCLIAMALKNSKTGSLPVSEIYSFMKEHFPYFKTAPDGWKNSVRHNLSLNKCFEKVENKASSSSRKGCLWALNPAKIDKMEEEMQKWKRKDLPAIRRSMANPDELDKLITDRPENCRRKALDPSMTRLPTGPSVLPMAAPTQLQCPPIVTLSLPCLPMHQHHQLHSKLQTRLQPMSPAPAQTPPLHVVPDVSHSPLAHQPTKPPEDFYSVQADTHTEVDTLDPSIMDFAFQGNIWEEMKDDSFNLDALGSFSNSPLRLSDCDLGSASVPLGSNTSNLPDVQVTGLYTSYPPQEPPSSQYMSTGASSKPIILL